MPREKKVTVESKPLSYFCDLYKVSPATALRILNKSGVADGCKWLDTPHTRNAFSAPGFVVSNTPVLSRRAFGEGDLKDNEVAFPTAAIRDCTGGLLSLEATYWALTRRDIRRVDIGGHKAYWAISLDPVKVMELAAWLKWCSNTSRQPRKRFRASTVRALSLTTEVCDIARNIVRVAYESNTCTMGPVKQIESLTDDIYNKRNKIDWCKTEAPEPPAKEPETAPKPEPEVEKPKKQLEFDFGDVTEPEAGSSGEYSAPTCPLAANPDDGRTAKDGGKKGFDLRVVVELTGREDLRQAFVKLVESLAKAVSA